MTMSKKQKSLKKYKGELPNKDWRNGDIAAYLKPLKLKGDSKMPTQKQGLLDRFGEWRSRQRRYVDFSQFAVEVNEESAQEKAVIDEKPTANDLDAVPI